MGNSIQQFYRLAVDLTVKRESMLVFCGSLNRSGKYFLSDRNHAGRTNPP